ncbi:hypothetical protein [Parasphingopyxis marina]|uniref:Uncharacterized protein n=1 Tax=Parasphingopyxis marina TaxID=2761622 RepID=A0A842HVW5_9SPHN|nr:hypothetical protein [Parasphingopyxis marina]MBC2777246.1 hypothetical protein [Parasphingopyxis marina]
MADAVKARSGARAERTFYLSMALLMAAGILGGFLPSWFLRQWMHQPSMLPLTPWIWIHGLVFTAWLALFVTQVGLISAGNRAMHQRLGVAGFGFAVILFVVGFAASLHGAARGSHPPFLSAESWLAVPILNLVSPALLIPLGLANRRKDPQAHKRYMLMAMAAFTGPGFGRIAFIPFYAGLYIPALFIVALVGWDIHSRGRIHRATWIGGSIAFLAICVSPLIWNTPAWLAVARWLMALWV